MKICVLIPTYNAAKTIQSLVTGIRKYIPDVLVIDDGSWDRTAQLAGLAQARVIYNPINHGKGAVLRQGFEQILKEEYDSVLTMDGDGQHSPDEIPSFIEKALEEKADLIIGNRLQEKAEMPTIRWMTNHTMSFFISKLIRQKIQDTQCGYRLIHRTVLQKTQLKSMRYEGESELVMQAVRSGFKVVSVPIRSIYNGETSQIRPFRDTLRFIRLLANLH